MNKSDTIEFDAWLTQFSARQAKKKAEDLRDLRILYGIFFLIIGSIIVFIMMLCVGVITL